MPRIIRDSAIVLQSRDYGESDRIINLFTEHHGRIMAIAKGASKSRKRFLNTLEIFTLISVEVARSRPSSMFRIDNASIMQQFPSVVTSYRHYINACLACELVSLWTREGDSNPSIFHLLFRYLKKMSDSDNPVRLTIFFKLYLLKNAGYAINSDTCHKCGTHVREQPVWSFVPAEGGFACRKCSLEECNITGDIPRILHHIMNYDKNVAHRLKISKRQIKHIWSILAEMHCHHLGRKPATYKLLDI